MPGFSFVFFTDLCVCMSEAPGTKDEENMHELRCVCVCLGQSVFDESPWARVQIPVMTQRAAVNN